MKLAEALLKRAEYQKKIDNLRYRIRTNIKTQENELPYEDPNQLLEELTQVNEALCEIVKKINYINGTTVLSNQMSISDALAEREKLSKQISALQMVIQTANERDYRLTHSELKMTITVDIAKIQKQIDLLSKQHRELDTSIQSVNWTTEI